MASRRRRPSAPQRPSPPSPPPPRPVPGALIAAPAALVALRALAAVAPGMWLWGVDLQRHLPAAVAWGTWAAAAIALVPGIAGALARAAAAAGEAARRRPLAAALLAAALAAAVVAALPDRGYFIGDSMMRQNLIRQGGFRSILPQSLPLDVALHFEIPRLLAGAGVGLGATARALGILEAALLGGLAVRFALLAQRGAAWGVIPLAALVVFGGHLAVFTGFPKATADQCVLTLLVAALGVGYARDGRRPLAFGLAAAAAILDHRAMAALYPAVFLAVGMRLAARDRAAALAAAALPPLVAGLAMLPRILAIAAAYDLPMHVRPGGAGSTALRALDLGNAALLLAPAATLLPPLLAGAGRALRRRDSAFLAVLALGFVPVALVVQPRQGMFRDWEVLAPAGLAATLLAAWLLGERPDTAAARRAAVATALVAVVSTLQLLGVAHSVEASLARARAFAVGAPARDTVERTFTWDYVANRNYALERWAEAAAATARVYEAMPTPGVLLTWGLASLKAGDPATAQRSFQELLQRTPEDPVAWAGFGAAGRASGDSAATRYARGRIEDLARDPERRARTRRFLTENPELWPEVAAALR